MKPLFEFFARRHILATLFTLMILLLGLSALRSIKRDAFPEVDYGVVVVQTTYPGASPEDVELNVTNRIEDELKEVSGIKRMTSTSLENMSVIELVLEPDLKDPDKAKTDLRDAVSRVTDLPVEVTESPLVTEIDTSVINICEVGITGELSYSEMREIAKQFEKKLEAVPGVSRVEKYGYRAREVKVEVSPRAMDRYQIPLREIIGAVQARNIRLSGGAFESYTSEKNVVTLAQFRHPMEVGDVIVRSTFDGPLIRVRDLAVISDDFEDETVISRINGHRAISFVVFKTEQADIIRTMDSVKKLIRQESARGLLGGAIEVDTGRHAEGGIRGLLNRVLGRKPGVLSLHRYGPVNITLASDTSRLVEDRLQILVGNAITGLILVVLVLTIFLNRRMAFWVAMGIPVSVMGVIFLLPPFGAFINSSTLVSMVLLVGIIVDDGIIISENIYRRFELGDSAHDAAVNGVSEVFGPVMTTVLTTFLAFAPMFFMGGLMGKFVFSIPLTVSLALIISLSESVIALPAHLAKGLEKAKRQNRPGLIHRVFDRLKTLYAEACTSFLKLRYLLVLLFVFALVLALRYATTNMDFIMFPSKGAERFTIGVELASGTSLQATADRMEKVEEALRDLPGDELDTFVVRVGQTMTGGAGENQAYVMVALTPFSGRTRTADQIIEELRPRIEAIEDVEQIAFVVDTGGPPVGKPVSLRVIGDDDEKRNELAGEVLAFLEGVDGVTDVESDNRPGKDQIQIRMDYPQMARVGLTVADVAQNVRIAYDGEVVTSLRDGDEDVEFRIQLLEEARRNELYLRNLSIPNAQNRLIKLGTIARLETSSGPSAYRHYDGQRTTTVAANVDQDVITALDASTTALDHFDMEDWPGLRLEMGGEAAESEESIVGLMTTFSIAFIGIYFLLVLLFNSFTQPFLVLFSVPFGLVGVIVAFAWHGEHFSFMGVMGIIGLIGVVVNDSLVLVDHLNELKREKQGQDMKTLVGEGTSDRLRAIVLTSLTTAAGLLPLAYGIGGTDIYMQPMALALGYGILFATPLTLVLIPCLYTIGADIQKLLGRRTKA